MLDILLENYTRSWNEVIDNYKKELQKQEEWKASHERTRIRQASEWAEANKTFKLNCIKNQAYLGAKHNA